MLKSRFHIADLGTSLVAVVVLTSVLSCSRPPMSVASVYVKTGTIGSAGGALTVATADDAALAGTSLTVPAGALTQPVFVTIAPSTVAVAQTGDTAAGPVVDFGPAGSKFAVAATMTLPLTAGQATDDLAVEAVEADGTASLITGATVANGLVSVPVSGFTHFGAVHHKSDVGALPCTANSDCADGQYCGGTGCGTAGTCTAMPITCPADCAQPELCGCDGQSYCNSCDGAAVGVRVSADACEGESDGGPAAPDAGGPVCSCPEIPSGACITAGSAPCFCPTEVACADAGTSDGGVQCMTYTAQPCEVVESCSCADGTTQTAGCVGPPTCADACCAFGGVSP